MIQSIVKALNILTLLAESPPEGLSLMELSAMIGQKVPTTFNLLSTLESQDFISRDASSKRYRLGPMSRRLGQPPTNLQRLKELVQPAIYELGDAIGETVIFTIYKQMLRHSLLAYESTQMLQVKVQIGSDNHIYQTATGRILLSQLSPAFLKKHWETYGEPKCQWPGIQDFEQLQTALENIRQSRQVDFEPQPGQIRALAVPVQLSDSLPASIGVFYPTIRHPDNETATYFLSLMQTAASQIGHAWRHHNTPCDLQLEEQTK